VVEKRRLYIRFQGRVKNSRANSCLGIFQMAFELRDGQILEKYFEKELVESIDWLKMHLKSPDVLKRGESFRAISWFQPRAKEPLKRIRKIKFILEEHGYIIDTIKTKNPGNVIYEDGWQVIAIPFKHMSNNSSRP
jgi:hypothetical protein